MTLRPYIAEMAYIPLDNLPSGLAQLKKHFTVTPRKYHADQRPEPIHMYSEKVPGYLGVPIDWAVRHWTQYEWEDRTVQGGILDAPLRPDPHHPRAAPGQAQFMADLKNAVNNNLTVFAMASTGTGKTVSTLSEAADLGRSTLVLCHLDRLANQWVEEAKLHLGLEDIQIGRVQQDLCQYWRPFVVGIMHSISQRVYPPAFYKAFGTVVWDEVDVCGAPMFAETLAQFPAANKIALSATKDRRDGCAKTYIWYFGEPSAISTAEALPMKVFVIPYAARMPIWGKQHQTQVKCLSLDPERNALCFDIIKLLCDNNRQILIVGERIEHLQHLMDRIVAAGFPEDEIGQYTGQVYTGKQVIKVIDGVKQKVKETAKVTKAYLDWAKEHARLFFATYKMIERGIDIPRLDAGCDITPRPDAEQMIGRVRRPVPGKPEPVWYTLHDVNSPRFSNYLQSRIKGYQRTNAEVIRYG